MTLPICPASRWYLYGMCRSDFDSKAVYFAIRPMCHKRGLRASGGDCGPVCAMWHPFGLHSSIRGGANVGSAELHDRCCPFVRYLGKKSPDNAHQKSWECAGPVGLFWHQHAGVILCQKSSFHHPAKFAQFYKCQQKKDKRACATLRTTVFLYWIKYWLKTLVPVQTPPRVGTDTAASRYSHRRL